MFYKLIIIVLLLLTPVSDVENNDINKEFSYVTADIKEVFKENKIVDDLLEEAIDDYKVVESYSGPMTAYGPDCVGCIGITASGYSVLNGNIYYNDEEFGKIRILAADREVPFGTVIRISGLKEYNEPVIAIVLDRGSAIGFNKKTYFDLLYNSERETLTFGCQYATYEVLRIGY